MSRSALAVLSGALNLLWIAGLIVALPGLAVMGMSARAGLWVAGESL